MSEFNYFIFSFLTTVRHKAACYLRLNCKFTNRVIYFEGCYGFTFLFPTGRQ